MKESFMFPTRTKLKITGIIFLLYHFLGFVFGMIFVEIYLMFEFLSPIPNIQTVIIQMLFMVLVSYLLSCFIVRIRNK